MWKNKIVIESSTFQFPKRNSVWQTERVCQFCKKVFCCKKCRDRHVDEVHPDLNVNCVLCASKALPLRQSEIEIFLEDEQLLCHIVNKHLPLHCQLCGDLVESKEDFKSFGACKWWFQYRNPLTSPVDFAPLEKKLKQCFLIDSDYNVKSYN
nr:PREDICTED: uncharacterized protein LOC105679906 [Linepithema humile]